MAEYLLLGGLFYAAYTVLQEGRKHAAGCKCRACIVQAAAGQEHFAPHRQQYADNEVLYNKVDWADNDMPVKGKIYLPPGTDIYQSKDTNNVEVVDAAGHKVAADVLRQQVAAGHFGKSLTGEPIDPKTFVHNNMKPFFGAKLRQNTDEEANSTRVDLFTGADKLKQEKHEINPMFEPQRNLTNPYGAGNIYGYYKNRYIPGNKRNNETPVPKIRVGPGLNRGYTSEPSGGFQQADTRDYVMPHTTNERRTLNNPKTTFMGRVVGGGSAVAARPLEPNVRPVENDLTREVAPDTYGIRAAQIPSAPPNGLEGRNMYARGQERDIDAELWAAAQHKGPAAAVITRTATRDGLVRESGRSEAVSVPLGTASLAGQWTVS